MPVTLFLVQVLLIEMAALIPIAITYSDADLGWTIAAGADAYPNDITQWIDSDGDGYGDNPPPATEGDSCSTISGTSTLDRFGFRW